MRFGLIKGDFMAQYKKRFFLKVGTYRSQQDVYVSCWERKV